MKQEAVFAIAHFGDGQIAVTTRPDHKESGILFGLPGGKVDNNESHIKALSRECSEEGWGGSLSIDSDPFYSIDYEGILCHWYVVDMRDSFVRMLVDYKDKHRGIIPAIVHYKSLFGLHNEIVLENYFKKLGL